MIMRAFYSSPLMSHAGFPSNPRAGVYDAMRRLGKLAGPYQILLSVFDVARCPRRCIWSPVLAGDVMRGEMAKFDGQEPLESVMMNWCLHNLRTKGFNTLVVSSAPRARDHGPNGQDRELALADELGLRILSEADLENG